MLTTTTQPSVAELGTSMVAVRPNIRTRVGSTCAATGSDKDAPSAMPKVPRTNRCMVRLRSVPAPGSVADRAGGRQAPQR